MSYDEEFHSFTLTSSGLEHRLGHLQHLTSLFCPAALLKTLCSSIFITTRCCNVSPCRRGDVKDEERLVINKENKTNCQMLFNEATTSAHPDVGDKLPADAAIDRILLGFINNSGRSLKLCDPLLTRTSCVVSCVLMSQPSSSVPSTTCSNCCSRITSLRRLPSTYRRIDLQILLITFRSCTVIPNSCSLVQLRSSDQGHLVFFTFTAMVLNILYFCVYCFVRTEYTLFIVLSFLCSTLQQCIVLYPELRIAVHIGIKSGTNLWCR